MKEDMGKIQKDNKQGVVCIRCVRVLCRPSSRLLGDIEEMDEIGYEDYFYGEGLTMIEWANLIEEILPDHYREITIEKDLEKGFDYRKITILDR